MEKNKALVCGAVTFFENRVACEIMWKSMEEPDGSHMTIQYGAQRSDLRV